MVNAVTTPVEDDINPEPLLPDVFGNMILLKQMADMAASDAGNDAQCAMDVMLCPKQWAGPACSSLC